MAHSEDMQIQAQGGHIDPPDELRELVISAYDERATDIHIDGSADGYRVCYRVDGVIQEKEILDPDAGKSLLNQVKVASEVGVERALEPEEDRITWEEEGESRGIRVTVLPTLGFESVHLRLLQPPSEILDCSNLGMKPEELETIRQITRRPEGLILVAGPTGAGKTTTMYSLTGMLQQQHRLICVSIEDPVEYDLPFVRQVQVDEENELSMQSGLSTLLRMDPDLILVGEVRDKASTLTAAQAAASGHFVLSTMHAQAPHLAIAGLRVLGVPNHLLGSTLRLIIVQNLVRRLCPECATPREPTDHEREFFEDQEIDPPESVLDARGCEACNGYGYHGRIGIFQVIPMDEETGIAIAAGEDPRELRDILRGKGSRSLLRDGLQKVADHVTSLDEIAKVYWDAPDQAQRLAKLGNRQAPLGG